MESVFYLTFPLYVSSISFHTRDSCPADVVEWNKRKRRFNCSKTEFYHCLLDERNRSGEFCTTERPSRVQIGYCPMYNSYAEKITTESCNASHGCPPVSFFSNEVYQYPACFKKDQRNYDGTTEGSVDSSSSLDTVKIAVAVVVPILLAVAVTSILCFVFRNRTRQIPTVQEEVPLLRYNEKPFCRTSVFYKAVQVIDSGSKFVCFHGRWGSGKTTTAKQVYLSITGREPVVIENFYYFDVSSFADSVIVEEPFLGRTHIKDNMLLKIESLCSKLGLEENKFVIFTFSEQMWTELSQDMNRTLSNLQLGELHDFCLNYESLTLGDRVEILRSNFEYYNPQKPFMEVEEVASDFTPVHVAYAETCKLLSMCTIFQTEPGPVSFSSKPLFYLKSHFEDMYTSTSEKHKFLLLVFMSLIQRKIDINKWTELHMLHQLFEACNLSTNNLQSISMIPEEFVSREKEAMHVLEDDFIQRMVLVVFGMHHFDKLLRFHRWENPPKWIINESTKNKRSALFQRGSEIEPNLYLSGEKMELLDDSCTKNRQFSKDMRGNRQLACFGFKCNE